MTKTSFRFYCLPLVWIFVTPSAFPQLGPKQGFSLKLEIDNTSIFGNFNYPAGDSSLYRFAAAPWVGGIVDTSAGSLKLVTTGYEGWMGPHYEFHPASGPADTIWKSHLNAQEPPDWSTYWGNLLPFNPISDQDYYSTFTDYYDPIAFHVPLGIRVVQSSFAWNHPDADGIIIIEYRLINEGIRAISNLYFGVMLEPYLPGSIRYDSVAHCAYQTDASSPPLGVAILSSTRSLDSLRFSFNWYEGPQSPSPDSMRYDLLSSGTIAPDQATPGDTRLLLGFGPYQLDIHDTLVIAVGVLSGSDVTEMLQNADDAKTIYLNGGIVTAVKGSKSKADSYSLSQNFPNPFNPATQIGYGIPQQSLVRISIYDVLGREVALLQDGDTPAGYHSVTWKGEASSGVSVASGMYFYRIDVTGTDGSSFTSMKKMMLLK